MTAPVRLPAAADPTRNSPAQNAWVSAFCRTASVTQRHTGDRPDLEADLYSAPVALVCWRPVIASRGSCRGSIQRRHGHIMLEQARGMRQIRTLAGRAAVHTHASLLSRGLTCTTYAAGRARRADHLMVGDSGWRRIVPLRAGRGHLRCEGTAQVARPVSRGYPGSGGSLAFLGDQVVEVGAPGGVLAEERVRKAHDRAVALGENRA
jgi:hypothetical protein